MAQQREKVDPGSDPGASSEMVSPRHSRVRFVGDAALVQGIRAGNPIAMAEFHRRFALPVQRILWSIMGPDHELADLHHDVFVRALQSIHKLSEPEALAGWMNSIAVHTARSAIEKRISRRRWAVLGFAEVAPEAPSPDPLRQLDAREGLRAIHTLLEQMPVPERIAFALRFVEELELTEMAEACEVSLATIKRRLGRAEARFTSLASRSPLVVELLQQGSPRWMRR